WCPPRAARPRACSPSATTPGASVPTWNAWPPAPTAHCAGPPPPCAWTASARCCARRPGPPPAAAPGAAARRTAMAPRQGGRLRDTGRTRGAVVEAAVRARLERAGLRTLASNVASRGGELDLVMREPGAEGDTVVFVEVRYRAGHA